MGVRSAILIVLVAPWCAGDWIRVSSPGMEVLTDAGERNGRRLLARFEQIRAVFVKERLIGEGASTDRPWPIRAFAFASENEFDSYRDSPGVSGFYTNGSERDYIALFAGPGAARVAFHEYVHLVLHHSALPMPAWFEEGTAEFYSTLEIEAGQVRVGGAIEPHTSLLKQAPWLTATELATATKESPFYTERNRAGIFYAQSWALVHMLNRSPGWRNGIPRFLQLLADERPADEAFREAFGKTMDRALAELSSYLPSMTTVVKKIAIEASAVPRVEHLTSADAALERVDLALTLHRPQIARTLLEKLPESAESRAGLGSLALVEGHVDAARREFERAIALGSRDASMYFDYAMLEREAHAPAQRVRKLLETATTMNPDFADAHFLLGVEATDDGTLAAAVDHLREAVRVRPRRSDYWHALAYAEWKLGQRENALRSARKALATAENEVQLHSAEALVSMALDEQQTPATPASAKRPAVTTPASWQNRKGDARIEGTLTQVDCAGPAAILHIDDTGRSIAVEVHHPTEVELVNAPRPSYQFSCGAQRLRVAVEYIAAEHEVTRIEFRP
jgi:tetratricopeptide (TPR) repeat protein